MSMLLENCAGFVHVVPSGSNGGVGFYKLEPTIENATGSACLIIGIPLVYQEITQPVVTLDENRILYVFGSAWTDTMINGMLLLGDSSTGGRQLATLLDWYGTNKVSASTEGKSVKLSVGGRSVDAYITGLRLDAANPDTNTQLFTLTALTANT